MGFFIAIEGADGSGKGIQTECMVEHAEREGYNVLMFSFPRYGEPSAEIVASYLNGKYGSVNDVHADLASLPFAIDRYAASKAIRAHLKKPRSLVIANRYVASNLAHQGTKFAAVTERQHFYHRLMTLEYDVLAIPRPDVNIVLLVPADLAQANIDKKATRSYTTKKRDIHEADADHLERAKSNYEELCELFPDEFIRVESVSQGKMRPIEDIHADIWQQLIETQHRKKAS